MLGQVPADGTVLLTLTYTVDAAADEEISVALVPDAGFTDISADPVSAVVVGDAEPVSDETVTTDDVPTTDDEPSVTVDESSEESTEENTKDDNNGDNKGNPGTGVALAVVPAVLAGAAIVVAKKRK